jgi:hypothetical protein
VREPEVTVEVGDESFPARATTAAEPERSRLFSHHAALMPFYEGFRKRTTMRQLPVVVLERLG